MYTIMLQCVYDLVLILFLYPLKIKLQHNVLKCSPHLMMPRLSCQKKRESGSKVIPLLSMLHHALQDELMRVVLTPENTATLESLRRQLRENIYNYPRFKKLGFFSSSKAADAEKRLISECAAVSQNSSWPVTPGTCIHYDYKIVFIHFSLFICFLYSKLWHHWDTTAQQKKTKNITADVAVEVQKYLHEPNIGRLENPLQYWEEEKKSIQTCINLL